MRNTTAMIGGKPIAYRHLSSTAFVMRGYKTINRVAFNLSNFASYCLKAPTAQKFRILEEFPQIQLRI
jgi:hypothetical protein